MEAKVKKAIVIGTVKANIFYIIILAVLLGISGSLDWWMAWVLFSILVAHYIINLIILDPELMAERASIKEGARKYDIFLAMFMSNVGMLITALVASLDKRFGWSPFVPIWAQLVGLLIIVPGCILITWAMASNKFFSTVVRIQKERGHTVSSSGPYEFVRHPGYLGAGIMFLGIPLLLGTIWAFVPVLLVAVDIIVRTALEDRVLNRELDGYLEFSARVRYRLLPGIW